MNIDQKECSIEIKQAVNIPGEVSLKIEIYPFTIKGLDYAKDISFEVKEKSDQRAKFMEDLENRDKKLKIEASFFQDMISSISPPQEDEEESDDENEEEKEKHLKKENSEEGKAEDEGSVKEEKEDKKKGSSNKKHSKKHHKKENESKEVDNNEELTTIEKNNSDGIKEDHN